MKIDSIELRNFRSFYGYHKLDLSGNSVVIYGENGTGKSSICKAINVFFDSLDKRRTLSAIHRFENIFSSNINSVQSSYKGNVEVKIRFTNKEEFTYNQTKHEGLDNAILNDGRKRKGFMDYKALIPIYLYKQAARKNNLFRYFVDNALLELKNPRTNKLIRLESERNTKELTPDFYKGVFDIVKQIEPEVNKYLRHFDEGLEVTFQTGRTWTTGKVYPQLKIDGHHKTMHYGEFLNEARLVALALSINLAVISEYQRIKLETDGMVQGQGPRILILDDVFIGMDLSNRLPFVEVLKKYFSDYQILMTTYDRNWYNLLRSQLDHKNWKFIEVYRDSVEEERSSKLIDSSNSDYLSKAKKHFCQYDFPATANYLRKAFESEIKRILPKNYLFTPNEDGSVTRNKTLKKDFNNLKKYLQSCSLDTSEIEKLELFTKILLNPLSHDDLESPIYKRELEEAFKLLDIFKGIESRILKQADRDTIPILLLTIKEGDDYHNYKVQLLEAFKLVKLNNQLGYSPSIARVSEYRLNKEPWKKQHGDKLTLSRLYETLCTDHNSQSSNYLESFRTNKGKKLSELAAANTA